MGAGSRLAGSVLARVPGRGWAARRAHRALDRIASRRRRVVICIPFLKFGGAERVAANLATALAHLYGPDSVAVLVTDWSRIAVRIAFPEDASIRAWFPPGVPVADIAAMRQLPRYPRSLSLRIALMTMKPELVININSQTMWELFQLHGAELSEHMRLATVAFCHARERDGRPIGFTATHLHPAMKHLSAVITDNFAIIDELDRELPLNPRDKAKFKCLYQYPTIQDDRAAKRTSAIDGRRQVLWASRVTRSKCPELLPVIAKLMPDCDFHAYGARELGYRFPLLKNLLFPHHDLGNALPRARNLFWHGPFKQFGDLPLERFDAMLYTGLYDGLPNVLLEAGARRLPIVASNVGGISELITDDTGWLVNNLLDAIEYAENLRACFSGPATKRSDALAALIAMRHSFDTFCRVVEELVGPSPRMPAQESRADNTALSHPVRNETGQSIPIAPAPVSDVEPVP